MSGLGTARIPFNVRMSEGMFRGEAIGIGDTLKDDCIFEVHLSTGDTFLLKAETDRELQRYSWTTAREEQHKLVPLIGRVIERYYSKMKAEA
jgi:hypothetical protein